MLSKICKVSKGPMESGLRLPVLALALCLVLAVAACGAAERVVPAPTPSAAPDAEPAAPKTTALATPDSELTAPEPTQSAAPDAESVAPEPTASAAPDVERTAPEPAAPAAPDAESVAPAPTTPATPDAESLDSEPTPSATPDTESIAPEPTPDYSITSVLLPPAHYGAATPSVEERIYDSDVIIRASLQSSRSNSLHFGAIEYLKGAGPVDITVHASTSNRNTAWDDRESVLFLSLPEGQATSGAAGSAEGVAAGEFVFTEAYGFTHPIYDDRNLLPTGYTIDTGNPVWLPAETEAGASGAEGTGAPASDPAFITDSAAAIGDSPPTISLSSLRSKITWVEGGEDIDGYDRCIGVSLNYQQYYRNWEAYYGTPWTLYQSERQVTSEAAEGTMVKAYGPYQEPKYHRFWLTGQDMDLFKTQIIDDDEVASNGYYQHITIARPLPAGKYRFFDHIHHYEYMPCNFTPENNHLEWIITAVAPESAVHEAFFDPVAIGGAVGADSANGVLKPVSFSVIEGVSPVSLTKIAWESGQVTVELEPSLSLAGHHADFIALDGSVSLRLDFDAAAETVNEAKRTLAWTVCAQPWESGDLLMLRISRSGEDLTGVTNDGPCNRPPGFEPSSYTFSIPETAAADAVVGSVLATDPDEGDTVSYSITGGNEDGKFAIDTGAGEITVEGALDYETTPEYTLIIAASDGHGGTATATASITVTGGSLPPAPVDLEATATHDSVTLTWRAPDDSPVTGYRVLRRTPPVQQELAVHVEDTGTTTTTYLDTKDVAAGTKYIYRVQAINEEGVGAASNPAQVTTAAPAPLDLAATATHNSVTLTWRAPDGATVTGYRILRRVAQSEDTLGHVADVAATVTTHLDADGVAAGTKYIYRVLAMYDAVEGDSARVAVTTNPAP